MEYPYFRRAREYHLYDDKGQRFLDLWQNDGRAIMGHRPGKFSQYLKNGISRGMWADYASPQTAQLKTLLLKIFPQYSHVGVFRNRERALEALKSFRGHITEPLDPLFVKPESSTICWDWRPLLPEPPEGEILFLRLPIAGLIETQIVLSKDQLEPEDNLSPIIVEGLIRLFHDYRNWTQAAHPAADFSGLTDRIIQKGPYICWKENPGNYEEIGQLGLKKRLLLPPESKYPLLIPLEISDYEIKVVTQFLEEALSIAK